MHFICLWTKWRKFLRIFKLEFTNFYFFPSDHNSIIVPFRIEWPLFLDFFFESETLRFKDKPAKRWHLLLVVSLLFFPLMFDVSGEDEHRIDKQSPHYQRAWNQTITIINMNFLCVIPTLIRAVHSLVFFPLSFALLQTTTTAATTTNTIHPPCIRTCRAQFQYIDVCIHMCIARSVIV